MATADTTIEGPVALVVTREVMPLLSRLFARWLYPESARSGTGETVSPEQQGGQS